MEGRKSLQDRPVAALRHKLLFELKSSVCPRAQALGSGPRLVIPQVL